MHVFSIKPNNNKIIICYEESDNIALIPLGGTVAF